MNLNFEHFEPMPGNFAGVNEGTPGFRRGEGAILGNTWISRCDVYFDNCSPLGRVQEAQVHIGGNSVTASFNILEDEVDIRFGADMLGAHRCCISLRPVQSFLQFESAGFTTPIIR